MSSAIIGRIMKAYFVLVGALLVVAGARADGVYRWEDKSGKVYYGDTPVQDSVQVEKKKLGDKPVADGEMPYETRRASEKFPVVLYVSDNCGNMCADAREMLDKRGIPFSEKTLSTKQEIDAFKTLSGGEIVPTISVGKSWIRGFQVEQWNSELDIAGYPKTSPYRNPPATAEQPTNEPVTEEPAAEEPAAETPDVETPAVEAPAVDQ